MLNTDEEIRDMWYRWCRICNTEDTERKIITFCYMFSRSFNEYKYLNTRIYELFY
jgi:hypothetical protein